jgi:rod shape-determining protein MreC
VTGSPGAFKVRPFAELTSLDWVSVLYFDTPALTAADPPIAAAVPQLSPAPEGSNEPAAVPAASAEPASPSTPIKHAGAADGPPASDGMAQAQQ